MNDAPIVDNRFQRYMSVSVEAMSYMNKELYKVPGPTKYFQSGDPLTTFTLENAELDPSVL